MLAGLTPTEIGFLIAILIAAGVVSGLFAGLFGVGGGAILVPVLYELLFSGALARWLVRKREPQPIATAA